MKKISTFLGAFAAVSLIGGGALAQSAGSFAGTSADGGIISLTVAKSGSTFTVTDTSVNMLVSCKHTGLEGSEGWGFYLNDDISSGQTDFTSNNDYYYITGGMHFVGHNTIKGTITSYTAIFVPGATPPAQAQFCVSPKQAFTLTKQAPGKLQQLPSNVDTGRLKPVR